MKIKRIEHIAIALKNMDTVKDVLANKLGIAMEYEEHLPAHATTLAMFPVGDTYLELLQSDTADSGTNKWIAERGEGLFDICLEVDDIDDSMHELRKKASALKRSNLSSAMATAASCSWTLQRRAGSSLSWPSSQRQGLHSLKRSAG